MFTLGPENSNHEYLRSAVNRHVIQKYDFHKRFNIHGILRDCISEYMLIKDLPCELMNQSVFNTFKIKIGPRCDVRDPKTNGLLQQHFSTSL